MASYCWNHLTGQLGLFSEALTRLPKPSYPLQSSSRDVGYSAAASLSNSLFLCLGRFRRRSVSPTGLADSQWRMKWQFHSDGITQCVYSFGFREEKEAHGKGRELFLTGQQNLQASEDPKVLPPFPQQSDFRDLAAEGWSVESLYSAVLLSLRKSWGLMVLFRKYGT